ncbi:hypothetical protein BVRB_024870, partial [Beta vulgaris subsp. vulgaris]
MTDSDPVSPSQSLPVNDSDDLDDHELEFPPGSLERLEELVETLSDILSESSSDSGFELFDDDFEYFFECLDDLEDSMYGSESESEQSEMSSEESQSDSDESSADAENPFDSWFFKSIIEASHFLDQVQPGLTWKRRWRCPLLN